MLRVIWEKKEYFLKAEPKYKKDKQPKNKINLIFDFVPDFIKHIF
jgi:hypothetical protein